MANHEPRLTAATVESPLPRDRHGGFGERPRETDRWQHRNRAPGRLNSRTGGNPDAATKAVKRWVSQSGRTGRPSGWVDR
jgi:hypothetical protein